MNSHPRFLELLSSFGVQECQSWVSFMSARAIEAVTAHINREVGSNIATAVTVIPVDTSSKGDQKATDSQMARAREGPGQTNIEAGHNQLEREALLVDWVHLRRCGVYVRRAWNEVWRVPTMEPDFGGFAENEVSVHVENRTAD